MDNVVRETDGFYSNNFYYGDTDSAYSHKKLSNLVQNNFVGKSQGFGKNDYGYAGLFNVWFLAPKIKYWSVINDYGVVLAKHKFKGYNKEHRMIKVEGLISILEGKTVSDRFSTD